MLATTLATTLASILLATGLWIGLPGILSGSRVIAKRGPDHLMHYPVAVPWFKGKVNTARWVVRTGRITAGGTVIIASLILSVAWWPTTSDDGKTACERLTPLLELGTIAGDSVRHRSLVASEHRCELNLEFAQSGNRFLNIEVDAPQALIGASLENQRLELQRRSMKLRPLPVLGIDAVMGFRPDQPESDTVILFSDNGATVRVETAPLKPSALKMLTRIFAEQKTSDDEQRGTMQVP